MKVALITGSFDPVTVGHTDIIRRVALCFDDVRVTVFINPDKPGMFSPEERVALLKLACADLKNVSVDFDAGMVADYVKREGISLILRAVRDENDLPYEMKMADYNRERGGVETVLLAASPEFKSVSSSEVRRRILSGDAYDELIPAEIRAEIAKIAKNLPTK